MAEKGRVWKTIYLHNPHEAGSLQSALSAFPHSGHTVKLDRFVGGGVIESDLSFTALRRLFSFASVKWRDCITDTKPSWEETQPCKQEVQNGSR